MDTVKGVLGALAAELVVLGVGWLLYERVGALASFVVAIVVTAVGALALFQPARWATNLGIWLILGGLTLLTVNLVALL